MPDYGRKIDAKAVCVVLTGISINMLALAWFNHRDSVISRDKDHQDILINRAKGDTMLREFDRTQDMLRSLGAKEPEKR